MKVDEDAITDGPPEDTLRDLTKRGISDTFQQMELLDLLKLLKYLQHLQYLYNYTVRERVPSWETGSR